MVYIYIYVYVYELTQSKEREIKVYNITYIFNLLNLNMACGIPKTFQVMAGSHLGLPHVAPCHRNLLGLAEAQGETPGNA